MGFRKPYILLKKLGLTRGKQVVVSEKCRDSNDVRVMEDSLSQVIYLDWDKKEHSIDYEKTRENNYSFYYEDFLNSEIRLRELLPLIGSEKVLDFGCGNGTFIKKLSEVIGKNRCLGIEKSLNIRKNLTQYGIEIDTDIDNIKDHVSAIFCFHVLEHLDKPEDFLKKAYSILSNTKGRLILEVPHANDPLIRFYKCEEFKKFTFWSQHLILHTCESLKRLCKYSGFKNVSIILKQRYPLSNHLYWINEGRPGGHKTNLSLLDNENLNNEYSNSLIRLGFSDSLIAICET
tara:strand:+ start:979 stop:1845 length:867 start_codon:yes stop_codon:yes gene_type:complete